MSDASLEELVREHAARRGPRGKWAVARVGGRLDITSPPGDGTTLSARLPTNVLGGLNGH